MSVGKTEAAGAVVEISGHIDDLGSALAVGHSAGIGKADAVYAVGVFV
jgi:hypothetical protein